MSTKETSTTTPSNIKLPGDTTLKNAAKISMNEDKPIMLDYWAISLEKKAMIGVRDNKEKILVKSEEEYTSTISSMYKSGEEYIIVTENSVYIVSSNIPNKRIS